VVVKKRFDIVFLIGVKAIGFVSTGQPYYIPEPITNTFRGMAYIYLCTDNDMYSTNKLELFEKEESK